MVFCVINAVAGVPLKKNVTKVTLLHSLEPPSTMLDCESDCKHGGDVEMTLNTVVLFNAGHNFQILGGLHC